MGRIQREKSMKYLSLFSGIEAVSVAAKNLKWQAAAFSENADFPCAVLKYHYPAIPNLGDVRNIKGEKYHGTVDIVIGGSPCQNFSIAGNRRGLHGEHSSLVWEFFRILSEVQPKWFLWENVPGALSTNNGGDFTQILTELSKLGYGLAWRVLNAQYFGVPQRRRRIFLVGYLGDWRPPAAVLFEPKSVPGNIKARRKKQCVPSRNIGKNTYPAMLNKVCPPILANFGSKQCLGNQEAFSGRYFVFDCTHGGECRMYNKCNTLRARNGTGGNNVPLVFSSQSYQQFIPNSIASTLKSIGGIYDGGSENLVISNLHVRRLTPLECERLQGFPDNYTDIPYKGKQHSPLSKRYEAIGNSMAVPVVEWILNRIDKVQNLLKSV